MFPWEYHPAVTLAFTEIPFWWERCQGPEACYSISNPFPQPPPHKALPAFCLGAGLFPQGLGLPAMSLNLLHSMKERDNPQFPSLSRTLLLLNFPFRLALRAWPDSIDNCLFCTQPHLFDGSSSLKHFHTD